MKKNNTAEKAVLEAKEITNALKANTEKTLKDIMNEAIKKAIMESEDDESEEDDYEVEEVETEENPTADEEGSEESAVEGDEMDTDAEMDNDEEEASEEDGEGEDDWSDMEKYKVGDNDYDFTGVDGDELIKVYNKLGEDDKILVKQEEDGTFSVKDEENGTEYIIELPDTAEDGEEGEGFEEPSNDESDDNLEIDFEGDGEDSEDEDFEIELDDEDSEEDGFGGEDSDEEFDVELDDEEGDFEDDEDIDIELDDEDEDEDTLNEENLGYTDSYQKDVFAKKFNMSEPGDSKTTYDMDGGAPKGNTKPWAGKGDSQPFDKKVNESDEMPVDGGMDANLEEAGYEIRKSSQTTSANIAPSGHKEYMNKGSHNVHTANKAGQVEMNEAIKKIIAKAKQIQEENNLYKTNLNELKKSLMEAAITNVTLGNIVKLLSENTITTEERVNIIHRFDDVKTLKESKSVYETVKRELNESKMSAPLLEKQFMAESSKKLNETVMFQTNNPALGLMERMDNLFKKNK